MFESVDIYSQNNKYIATFIASAIIFFIMSPGVLFEIDVTGDQKCKIERKTSLSVGGVHALIFGALMLAFYYFYLNKNREVIKQFGNI